MKRGAAAGSALGTALLALLLLRGSATGPGVAAVNPTQMEHLAAAVLAEAQSSPKTWPEDGPSQAARRHRGGQRAEVGSPFLMRREAGPLDKPRGKHPRQKLG